MKLSIFNFAISLIALTSASNLSAHCSYSEGLSARAKTMMSCADYAKPEDQSLCLEGERLFYDKSLSPDGRASCSSCHSKELQYTDNRERPYLRGEEIPLSRTLSLKDIARRSAPYFWNGRAESLSGAIYWPLYQAREIGATTEHLKSFGGGKHITRALSSYLNTLNSEDAPLDRYLRADCKAMSARAIAGLKVFKDATCTSCHETSEFAGVEVKPYRYENLPEAYFKIEEARYGQDWQLHAGAKGTAVTLEVKAPSLRNLPSSGPFGQFGQSRDLDGYLEKHFKQILTKQKITGDEKSELLIFLREGLKSSSPPAKH